MTPERETVRGQLERWTGEESQLLAELETLLQAEQFTLRQDDIESLERIGRSRQRCVQQLSRLDLERAEVCRRLSLGVSRTGLARLFAWSDPSGTLERRWLANLELARRCRDINDGNGAIVTARLAHVRQLLGGLRGTAAPPVYSARGMRYGTLTPRVLGSA
jgi:flagellar biosynthesis/type III secretory pathway chaperone